MKEISAGGVVYRKLKDGTVQIQMIEDRYGKMTLAKGKQEAGERIEQTALREIEEETGVTGRIVAPLMIVAYTYEREDGIVVDKQVHYYLVEAIAGHLQPQLEEITEVRWHTPHEAWRLQRASGYDNNDEVMIKALDRLGVRVS